MKSKKFWNWSGDPDSREMYLYGTIAPESWFEDDVTPEMFRRELMAGTTVLMAPTALMMLHNPATIAAGDHNEMEKAISMLDEVKESIINAYEIKTGLDRKSLSKMMEEETWLNAEKAVELGFADGILEREPWPVTDRSAPILFSQRAVDKALVNRAVDFVGVPVQPLYDRLERLKSRSAP